MTYYDFVVLCSITSAEVWQNIRRLISEVLCQKQVSRSGTSNYIPHYLWDVINFSYPWYLHLVQQSWYQCLINVEGKVFVCEFDRDISTCEWYLRIEICLFVRDISELGYIYPWGVSQNWDISTCEGYLRINQSESSVCSGSWTSKGNIKLIGCAHYTIATCISAPNRQDCRVIILSCNISWWRHQMEDFPRYWPLVRGIHGHRWIPLTPSQ